MLLHLSLCNVPQQQKFIYLSIYEQHVVYEIPMLSEIIQTDPERGTILLQ